MKHVVSHFYHIPKFLKNDFLPVKRPEISTHQAKPEALISELFPSTATRESGGAKRDRTADLLRAKQALSQLSYGPVIFCTKQLVGLGRFELPTSPLSGVRSNQLSYRPITGSRYSIVFDYESSNSCGNL